MFKKQKKMETFNKLKSEYQNAPNKEVAEKKLQELTHLVNQDPNQYGEAFLVLGREKLEELKELNIKEALKGIDNFISLSYIAKNYFNKSKEWLYQRINGNLVNGKPAKFTPNEIEVLNNALQDLSKKIGSVIVG